MVERMEDNLNGRCPLWKTTLEEDSLRERPPQRKVTLIDWNNQNLICNICRSNLLELKRIFKTWKTFSKVNNINISSAQAGKQN
jgi:hypothetical protein